MAKELIAVLVTDNNGEAFHNYTGTGAGQTTFVAESGDLESEPLIINDISESITLTSDKNILSYADNDTVTLTATYDGTTLEGKSVVFKIGSRVLDTVVTDSEGVAEYEYISQGIGDLVFTAECGELVETITIEDCIRYDSATSDKTNDYSLYCYRGSGSASWNYNSNGYYYGGITNQSEHLVQLSEVTGQDNFTIEFDAMITINNGLIGICACEDTSNFTRISTVNNKSTYRECVNGSCYEDTANHTDVTNQWCHYKYTVSDNKIVVLVKQGDTTIESRQFNYTPTINTKFGIALVWDNSWVQSTHIKNIKINSLDPVPSDLSVTSDKSVLSYVDSDSAILTATVVDDNDDPIENASVVFKNGSTVLDTVTTDSNGEAEYEYTATGIGDITLTAQCRQLTETIDIEDCQFYDASSSSNLSKYDTTSINGGSLTYDSTESAYKHTKSSAGFSQVFVDNLTVARGVKLECDVKIVNGSGNHHIMPSLGLMDTNGVAIDILKHHSQSHFNLQAITTLNMPSTIKENTSLTTSSNVWYHIEFEITNNDLTAKLYNGDTLIATTTNSNTIITTDTNTLSLLTYINNGYYFFKNLKIKTLPSEPLSVSSDVSVLSYADNDTATITAKVTDGHSNPISGETVTFKQGSTTLGTDTTDSNGEATYTYSSQGVGDVTITVECMNLQETCELEDCERYDPMTSSTQMGWKLARNNI